ncbi:hypothetical protein JG688_00016214 [Phytophthora aleatoria]|uniref:Uncharacterized protein n=1 Tax=Phytophthora aleatoria TaxID=2496075 RepID=A0A8J5ICR8_9STRA|nr:hypothetical protein JG688_00016214 [Phytophthora aleatoria]
MKKSVKLLAQQAGTRTWTIALLDYFQKRFFRVYPLFAVTAIVLSCVSTENQQNFNVNKPEDYDLGVLDVAPGDWIVLCASGFRRDCAGSASILVAWSCAIVRVDRTQRFLRLSKPPHAPRSSPPHIYHGLIGSCGVREVGFVDQRDEIFPPLGAHTCPPCS